MSPLNEETIEASLTRINTGLQSRGSQEVFEQAHPAFRGVTTGNSPQLLSRKVLTRGGGSSTHLAATVFCRAI